MVLMGVSLSRLTLFSVLYSMIILSGLRAHMIAANRSDIEGFRLETVSDSLSFLKNFAVYDGTKHRARRSLEKEIFKRSISQKLAPQYMLDLYEYLHERPLKLMFDTARSFRCYDSFTENDYPINLSDKTKYVFKRVRCDLVKHSKSELIQFAQLRIQLPEPRNIYPSDLYKAEFYFLTNGSFAFIGSVAIAESLKNSLISMDITSVIQESFAAARRVLDFVVTVPTQTMNVFAGEEEIGYEPQLLLLTKSDSRFPDDDLLLQRMKRSLGDHIRNASEGAIAETGRKQKLHRVRRSEEDDEEIEEQTNYIMEDLGRVRKGKMRKKKNPCRRRPLHINFADINFDQWIIAPEGYEAFECYGRCSFPMSSHLTPTKHAIIQTLMHSLKPKQVSRACCVPTKLESTSVLYIEDDGVVTYKYNYEDMVIAECGCR